MKYKDKLTDVSANICRMLSEIENDELLDVAISDCLRRDVQTLCEKFLIVETPRGTHCIDLPPNSIRDAVLSRLLSKELLDRFSSLQEELAGLELQKNNAVADARFDAAHDYRDKYRLLFSKMQKLSSQFSGFITTPLFSSVLQDLTLKWYEEFNSREA